MTDSVTWKRLLGIAPLAPVVAWPGLGLFGGLAIVLAVLALVKDSRPATLAMLDRNLGRSVALGAIGGLAIAALGRGIDLVLKYGVGWAVDLSDFDAVRGNLTNYLILLAVGIGVGGVLEELVFRGFVVGWGSALFGERAAPLLVLLSASAFGFAHMYQGPAGMISTGLVGALIGFLYLFAHRKLLVAMVAHATVNLVGVTVLFLDLTP